MSLATAFARFMPGQQRAAPMPVQSTDWADWIGVRSAAGVTVSPDQAMALATVQACVSLIARSLASVPLVLYRRTAGGREPAIDHPLYPILHDLANPLQSAFDVRQALFVSVLLYGNGYAEIGWGEDGYPRALWPLPPDRVSLYVTSDRTLLYQVSGDVYGIDGRVRWLPAWRVHHLRGLTTSGLLGVSPLRAANAVGLALATEEFGARFFGEGAHPSVVLSHPAKLGPEAVRNLRASFEAQWGGMSNAHRVAVVGEGVKPEAMRIAPNESQFLETRAFQVEEICRIYNVSPGLVGAAGTQTYASAEQDLIRFRELTLGPWAKNHREALQRDLLTPDERQGHFIQYKLSALQATDLKTRYEAHQIALMTGFNTANEIREMEDYNPVPGGDQIWMPLNMGIAEAIAAQSTQPDAARSPGVFGGRQPDTDGLRDRWLADIEQRLRARVANDARLGGSKAMRMGGMVGLAGWYDVKRAEWLKAGLAMLTAMGDQGAPYADQIVRWIDDEWTARRAEIEVDHD